MLHFFAPRYIVFLFLSLLLPVTKVFSTTNQARPFLSSLFRVSHHPLAFLRFSFLQRSPSCSGTCPFFFEFVLRMLNVYVRGVGAGTGAAAAGCSLDDDG